MIRPFRPKDRAAVRSIALATAMAGAPAARFFDGDEVMADALTLYFTDHEPASALVVDQRGAVAGYLIGAMDTHRMDRFILGRILWICLGKAVVKGVFLSSNNWKFFGQVVRAVWDGRMCIPDLYKEYPATLHINMLPGSRAQGAGAALLGAYEQLLCDNKVSGVRLATMSELSGNFFEKNGFKLLYRSTRPYFHHILGRDVPCLIYGKKLLN